MKYIKLHNGYDIPVIGSGTNTFGKVEHDYMGDINGDTTELQDAIALGYRHFDTAVAYRNESVIGKALSETLVSRSEFYITSKIPTKGKHYDNWDEVASVITESLDSLNLDYIDLYLVHHPTENLDQLKLIWRVMEDFVNQGKIRSIGVSNFDELQLAQLLEFTNIKPSVNQIESHPGNWNDQIVNVCQSLDIVPVAWGPLTRISNEYKSVLQSIGAKYQATWAQIALAYQINRNVVVIPKSHNRNNQEANFESINIELTDEDMELIQTLQ